MALAGLVVFVHGLGGDEKTWGGVPDFVSTSLGADFDVASAPYESGVFSPANLETSASQIVTLLLTEYADRDPIYLIGHSLGGLVAREICRKLLVEGPDHLLQRMKAAITAGSPLEGVPVGNWVARRLSIFNPKVAALGDPETLFSEYRIAIREAQKRKIKDRPKLLHLRLEGDRVVAKLIKDNFTDDDQDAGTLRGTHTRFAKGRANAEYVAGVLVSVIRGAQNSHSTKTPVKRTIPIAANNATASASLPDRLLLIACSGTKQVGGANYKGTPLSWMRETAIRQDFLAKRNYIYSILRDGKLEDNFERGGNRSHSPGNEKLVHGIDLGGLVLQTGEYLPAYERYSGRIYKNISMEAWQNNFSEKGQVKVLIMSGLYGLIEPTEFIQNYDVHLSDTNKDYGLDVKSQWLELYTKSLVSYVQHAFSNGRRVKIFNFLCDHHYVDAVRWHSLPREMCSVFHFVSPTETDVNLLPPAGTLVDAILKRPEILEGFDRDKFGHYPITEYGTPPQGLSDFKFGFESRVGLSSPSTPSNGSA